MAGKIYVLNTVTEFNNLVAKNNVLIVIDFYATWCGPCKKLEPFYEKLSQYYENVLFFKCNIEHAEDLANQLDITAMPTFHFYKNGKLVHKLEGCDPKQLENTIRHFR